MQLQLQKDMAQPGVNAYQNVLTCMRAPSVATHAGVQLVALPHAIKFVATQPIDLNIMLWQTIKWGWHCKTPQLIAPFQGIRLSHGQDWLQVKDCLLVYACCGGGCMFFFFWVTYPLQPPPHWLHSPHVRHALNWQCM